MTTKSKESVDPIPELPPPVNSTDPQLSLPRLESTKASQPSLEPPPPPPPSPQAGANLAASEQVATVPQLRTDPKQKSGIQRAIEAEMTYQRQYFANHLFNNVRSAAPPPAAPPHTLEMKYEVRSATPPHTLEVKYERAAVTDQYLMATFRFDQNSVENLPVHITYRGFLDDVITEAVPMSMVVLTYHEHVGKPLPKWAFHSLPLVIQARRATLVKLDEELRKKLKDGKAHTLSMLFDSKGDEDTTVQAVSILRYLTWRHSTQIEKNKPTNEQALVRFLVRGQSAGWEVAAREQYGFLTLDEMQSLWIEWLKSPASRFTDAAPNLIPSLSLPIPKPKYIAPISVDEPIAPNLDKGDEGAPKPVPGPTIPRIPEKR